jgi:DeoR family glycerol-3-phosphate regulon repressor
VSVSREIIRLSRQTILVADAMKFERSAPVRIAHLRDIQIFVTDRPPPESALKICEEHGVRLEIAGEEERQPG